MLEPHKHADVIDATAAFATITAMAMHSNRETSLLQHQHVTWISIRKKMRVFRYDATFSFMNFLARKMNEEWRVKESKKLELKSAATSSIAG